MLAATPDALAIRYASPTGTSGLNCHTPATACDLTTAIQGAPGNEPTSGEEVVVEPGTYKLAAKIETGASSMNIHGAAGKPMPVITGSVSQLLWTGKGGTFADMEIQESGSGEAVFADAATLERLRVIGKPSGNMLCQCYDGLIRDSIFIARPGSTTGAVGVNSNGGTATETLRNDTIYSESKEAPAIELAEEKASGSLALTAIDTIAVNAAGGHDVTASEFSSITLNHSDYTSPTGAGTISDSGGHVLAQPLFANAAGGDFHELAGSPTIDAGIANEANGPVDFDGNPRTTGTAPDIGAYEYQPPKPAPSSGTPGGNTSGTSKGITQSPAAPQITLAKLNRSIFRAARHGATIASRHSLPIGATLSYWDSQAATTTIRILGRETGHRSGHGCRAGRPRAHQKPCRRARTRVFEHADVAGGNTLRLSGHGLPAGAYTLTLTPVENGLTGATITLTFRIAG